MFSSPVFCNRVYPQISFNTATVIKETSPLKGKSLNLPQKQEVVVGRSSALFLPAIAMEIVIDSCVFERRAGKGRRVFLTIF